jgi:hypothetical protein
MQSAIKDGKHPHDMDKVSLRLLRQVAKESAMIRAGFGPR